jgi:DMSO reductase anchor subunit
MRTEYALLAAGDVCEMAKKRYHDIARFRHLYTALLFGFSVFIMGTLVALVYFINDKQWIATAVAALGLIVESSATKFVGGQRKEAKQEEEDAWADYYARCPDKAPAVRQAFEAAKILGVR